MNTFSITQGRRTLNKIPIFDGKSDRCVIIALRWYDMMTVKEARQKAEESIMTSGLHIGGAVLDDGEYFIFGYAEEPDLPPVGIRKDTGEAEDYFPPDHPSFMQSRRIRLS